MTLIQHPSGQQSIEHITKLICPTCKEGQLVWYENSFDPSAYYFKCAQCLEWLKPTDL